jgi:hypothetical protein
MLVSLFRTRFSSGLVSALLLTAGLVLKNLKLDCVNECKAPTQDFIFQSCRANYDPDLLEG